MYASHASLSDDYEVSCAELDAVVEIARNLASRRGLWLPNDRWRLWRLHCGAGQRFGGSGHFRPHRGELRTADEDQAHPVRFEACRRGYHDPRLSPPPGLSPPKAAPSARSFLFPPPGFRQACASVDVPVLDTATSNRAALPPKAPLSRHFHRWHPDCLKPSVITLGMKPGEIRTEQTNET